jgi:hypothetical protein
VPQAEWDPEHPPAEPPAGADPLIWRLAYGLYRDHYPHTDGFCVTCREFWPCAPRRLADQGFSAAFPPPGDRRPGPPDNSGHRY